MKKRDSEIYYIDLHGFHIHDAYQHVSNFLYQNKFSKLKKVKFITGKSGEIKREFPFWMDNLGYQYTISDGGGSFIVNFNKSDRVKK